MRNYVAGLCLLAVPVISMGEPEVRIVEGTGTINSFSVNFISGKYRVDITAVADTQMTIAVEIPQGDSDIIEWVRVESNDPNGDDTIVEVTVRQKPGTNGQLVRVEEVKFTSDDQIADGELWIWVDTNGTSGGTDGNIGTAGTTPGGLIEGHVIRNLTARAAGNLTAEVTTLARLDGGTDANIDGLTIAGDILNDISTTDGRIRDITVTGNIGASGSLITITTTGDLGPPNPAANLSIESISASAIYANITTPNTTNDRGDMGSITTTSGDFVGRLTTFAMQYEFSTNLADIMTINGDLDADIQTNTIKRPIVIEGDLKVGATITMKNGSKAEGDIRIDGALEGLIDFPGQGVDPFYDADIVVGSISSTGQILIKDDMTGSIDCEGVMAGFINIDGKLERDSNRTGFFGIRTAASSLTGQIIINSADGGGAWVDDVTIGMTVLDPNGAYEQTGLGGGAVGLVAFDCHLQDCVPAATSSMPGILGNSSTNVAFHVTLTHYGPVTWTSDIPIQVLFCSNDPICDADVDVTGNIKVTSSKQQRFIVVEPIGDDPGSGEYHLSPKVDVKCFGISAGTPPSVVSYTYNLEYNMN